MAILVNKEWWDGLSPEDAQRIQRHEQLHAEVRAEIKRWKARAGIIPLDALDKLANSE